MPRASKAADDEEPLSRQSLKAAVWYTVTKIAQEEELSLPFAASEHFVATLAEVVFQQALSLGKDLERFANHAGRLTINADDVKLAARRNEPLYELLCTTATQHGLTLADIKADSAASTSKASKVKAPRLAAGKSTTTASTSKKSSTSAGSEGAKERSKSKEKSKVKEDKKGKKRAEESDADEQIDDPDDDDDEPRLAGGFVKASALKKSASRSKGKGKAVVADSEDDDDEDGRRGGSSGDESEEVGAKRKRTSKSGAGTSKKRRSAE
ncbi:CENP-S family protein [Rhodotorula paludigena]|uniref:CENP-S family protein n=1 Tax=Rhodotorula paludigena TaxID=86838 RepID=UPI0031795526